MIKSRFFQVIPIALLAALHFHCSSQVASNAQEKARLTLVSKIPIANVSGRIDHIAYDQKNDLAFIAALGNNSVEILDLREKRVVRTITGLHEPQGIIYIPFFQKLIVANGAGGDCICFDGKTFKQSAIVHLNGDADNIRYDSVRHLLYVGYGDGGIAVIDPKSMAQIGNIPLDGHPEAFQISQNHKRIYINVPDADEIEVADLLSNKIIGKWKNQHETSNYPMALDETNDRLFIGYRRPAKLKAVGALSGKDICVVNCSGDADDIFYSPLDSLLFVSAGKGIIDVFKTTDRELVPVNHIKTSSGARTALLLPTEKKYLLAVPSRGKNSAALWIYKID